MRRLSVLVLVLAAVAGISSLAQAADKEKPANQKPKKPQAEAPAFLKLSANDFIKRFDKNGDGVLTKDELPPRLAPMFDKADTNGDGKLDKQEVERMLQVLRKRFAENAKPGDNSKPATAKGTPGANDKEIDRLVDNMLQRMDANKDGKISREEAKGPLAQAFDKFDTNKDGFLDREELRRLAAARLRNAGPGGRPANPGEQPRKPTLDFDALDLNADGRLTREELKGTPLADKFDEIDTNKDGKIDRKEFEAYLKKQKNAE